MSQPLYKVIPIAEMGLAVAGFRLTNLVKSKPSPLVYLVLAELFVAMCLTYVSKAGTAAVIFLLLAAVSASLIRDA